MFFVELWHWVTSKDKTEHSDLQTVGDGERSDYGQNLSPCIPWAGPTWRSYITSKALLRRLPRMHICANQSRGFMGFLVSRPQQVVRFPENYTICSKEYVSTVCMRDTVTWINFHYRIFTDYPRKLLQFTPSPYHQWSYWPKNEPSTWMDKERSYSEWPSTGQPSQQSSDELGHRITMDYILWGLSCVEQEAVGIE